MRPKVLVVEDEVISQEIYRDSLGKNVESYYASTSSRALASMTLVRPDIVFLDLGLPDADGLAIIPTMVNYFDERQTTVIVVTASSDQKRHQAALASGAKAVVQKPFEPEEIRSLIDGLTL